MEKEKRKKRFVLFMLAFALFFPILSAANIGISPATINFEEVMRSGYAQRMIVVSVDSEDPIDVEISTRGEISEWLDFSEWNFSVSKNSPKYVLASVNPPIDSPNGNYTGFIRFMTSPTGEDIEGHAVGKISSSLDLYVKVEVTDVEIVQCKVSKVKLISVEEGEDILLKMNILNEGNIRLRPKVFFNVWDYDQLSILDYNEFYSQEILPTTEKEVEFRISSKGLDLGQYWSDLSVVECLYDSLLTFDILEEGALSSNIALLSILTHKTAKIKETVPIEVNFKNIGEKEVVAQFKGKVTREGKIVQILESEEVRISVDELEKFGFYFTPERGGKYIVTGRIYYGGKKTFESNAVLEVEGGFNPVPLIYFFLFLSILILSFKIRQEKKRFKMKLRHLK
jgi:hypothetical protein